VQRNSVYEMTYRAGILRAPDGTPVTVLDPSAVTDHTLNVPHAGPMHTNWLRAGHGGLVYNDPGGARAWVESMALTATGAPATVYATYANTSDAQYYYARWNGSSWTKSHIVDAGGTIDSVEAQYSGGADIDHSDPGTVYLSRETSPGSGRWEVEDWRTTNSGASFSRISIITPNPMVKNVRPVVPWGPSGEIKMLWMSGTYTDYHAGKYHTQLRELTTGRAPTTARISASATTINAGATVRISGRIVQGYRGLAVPGALVELLGHTAEIPTRSLRG
jgi:hypothetical protein